MNIGEQILFLRKNRGITQEQLAQKLGITNQAVSKWESGQCLPDIQLLPEIAEYFNVSVDELMGRTAAKNDDDILIILKNKIECAESGTEMAQIMKLAKALHAIVLVMESQKTESGYPKFEMDETIEHAIDSEWGFSSITQPDIVATMKQGSVFFSDDHKLYDESSIKKISRIMKCVSDKLVLSVLFAIYDLTSMNDNSYASLKQICDITDLSLDTVESIAEESLSQFCIVSKDKSYRIKGEYMNIPPILSILHPSIDIF